MSKQYSEYIMKKVRQRHGLDEDDKSRDEYFFTLSEDEIFDAVLSWEGLVGFTHTIKDWVEEIYEVEL